MKALLDGYWLADVDENSLLAFGFLFPVLILINTVLISSSNSMVATVSQSNWLEEKSVDITILLIFSVFALVLGGVIGFLLIQIESLLVHVLDSSKFQQQMSQFIHACQYWLPTQFLSVVLLTVARGAGLYRSSGNVAIVAGIIGTFSSFYLLNNRDSQYALESVVISNAIISSLTIIFLIFLFLKSVRISKKIAISEFVLASSKKMLTVFCSSLLTNLIPILFIFLFIRTLGQHGDSSIAALAYLTRVEQIILTFFYAIASIMILEASHLLRSKKPNNHSEYIHQCANFLLSIGMKICIGLILLTLLYQYLYSPSLSNDELMLIIFWLLAISVQGTNIFYLQVLNIIHAPLLAVKLNALRFVVIGIPLLYLSDKLFGVPGAAITLLIVQSLSLYIFHRAYKQIAPIFSNN